MTGRCTGHCCRCFVLSVDYEELRKSVTGESVTVFQDGAQILDMLVPLGKMTKPEANKRFGVEYKEENFGPYPERERFTCRHIQENGDCGIYEGRPLMCRSFPKAECGYAGCTASCSVLSAIREKEKHPACEDGAIKAI